jgi:methylmalonyl-CoA mutase
LGGADSIEIRPFTAARGLADGAARRLARNTSLILIEESNLHRVIDPAAGAGGIEALTDSLAAKAWHLFQMVEAQRAEGEAGLPAALRKGFLPEMIRDTRDARLKAIATRKAPITGISEFPDPGEAPIAVLAPMPESHADHLLAPHRLAEPFEALRDRADAVAARTDRPRLFLANLGRIADFTARATFAKNLFEAGGFTVIGNDGFADGAGETDLGALIAAFRAAQTPFACLASSDDVYASPAAMALSPEEVARHLRKAGAISLVLAGKPGAQEARYREAGVAHFAYSGCDVLGLLDTLLTEAGA